MAHCASCSLAATMLRLPLLIRRAAGAALLVAVCFAAPKASAQNDRVQAGHKGMIGLGLVGAELGFYVPTAFGLTETWSLITFPVVGAAGGAVGGFYLDRANSRAASVSVLVVGLALAVPTVILTVGNTRYSTDDLRSDTEALERRLQMERRLLAGNGLLRRVDGRFQLAMPGIDIGPAIASSPGDGTSPRPHGTFVGMTLLSGAF